jgi:hypothetical protein
MQAFEVGGGRRPLPSAVGAERLGRALGGGGGRGGGREGEGREGEGREGMQGGRMVPRFHRCCWTMHPHNLPAPEARS